MPRQYTPRVGLTCANCAKAFTVPAHRGEATRYCSQVCHYAYRTKPMEQRFLALMTKTATCWLFPIHSGSNGYGSIALPARNRHIGAHTYAWYLASGQWPGDDEYVCHTCDIKNCVRNDGEVGTYEVRGMLLPRYGHLFLGTPTQNAADCADKKAARQKRAVDCPQCGHHFEP
jgi:hypothetical protein